MKFTTSCFVRVEDAEKRKELTEWLEEIGYKQHFLYLDSEPYIHTWPGRGDCVVAGYSSGIESLIKDWIERGNVDCDTNIDLFKELASMTDSLTDGRNWFTDGKGNWARYPVAIHSDGMVFKGHRATADEIVEHFKKQEP